jgi:hypothetical protein
MARLGPIYRANAIALRARSHTRCIKYPLARAALNSTRKARAALKPRT